MGLEFLLLFQIFLKTGWGPQVLNVNDIRKKLCRSQNTLYVASQSQGNLLSIGWTVLFYVVVFPCIMDTQLFCIIANLTINILPVVR